MENDDGNATVLYGEGEDGPCEPASSSGACVEASQTLAMEDSQAVLASDSILDEPILDKGGEGNADATTGLTEPGDSQASSHPPPPTAPSSIIKIEDTPPSKAKPKQAFEDDFAKMEELSKKLRALKAAQSARHLDLCMHTFVSCYRRPASMHACLYRFDFHAAGRSNSRSSWTRRRPAQKDWLSDVESMCVQIYA